MSAARGIRRERQVRALLEADGWWTARAAGSLGDADVIALRAGRRPLMVEVKSTAGGPWHSFGPRDRLELLRAAERAGAEAYVVWWPAGARPVWIAASDWPGVREAA